MNKDEIVLMKIISYADRIDMVIKRFSLDYEKFAADFFVQDAISMCILQIGELANKLSKETTEKYNEIPWRAVVAMRNRAAHEYDAMDKEMIWKTATESIPRLKVYCKKMLEKFKDG